MLSKEFKIQEQEQKETMEDMKCCGNCKHRPEYVASVSRDYACLKKTDNLLPADGCCESWEFDGLKRKERINFRY